MQMHKGAVLRKARRNVGWDCEKCGQHIPKGTLYVHYQPPDSPPWAWGERLCQPCGEKKYGTADALATVKQQLDRMLGKVRPPAEDRGPN